MFHYSFHVFKTFLVFLLVGCIIAPGNTQNDRRFPTPLSPRTSNYDIELTLDTAQRKVFAEQEVTFKNPSADTVWTMQFHMYYNAFKNNKSTFMTGSGRIPRNKPEEDIENCNWGWIEVMETTDENEVVLESNYIQLDDGNIYDHTVLEVKLQTPVLPYESKTIQMTWESRIPELMSRTGYRREFYFMAQWYPKLGVYEPEGSRFAKEGQWNCHQYHPSTEYFGEFGVYKVQVTIPESYTCGASGFMMDEKVHDGQKTYTFLAEDVIDFTWAAHPEFEVINEKWRDTDIRLLIMPEHVKNKDRFLGAAKNTLDFYADYIEPYPYPSLTIVSPPYYGLNAGAMEYPTLITAPTMCCFPKSVKTTETLTIHELTHQYFMQMLSTNEQEEPWMDEGFTAYFEAKIMDKYYPEGIISWADLDIHVGSEEYRRGRFFNAENIKVNPLSDFGWEFIHGSYHQIVYGKAAVVLHTLEGLVGPETMKEIMQTYFARWKFKHPGRQNFIDVVNEVVPKYHKDRLGENMDWFFEQAIYGTEVCDYAVGSIRNVKTTEGVGLLENTEDCTTYSGDFESLYSSRVILFRLGEFVLPQEIRIVFDDGEEIIEHWDGKARSHDFSYIGARQIECVEIDPARKIPLDKNLINNSYTTNPDTSGISRYFNSFLTWMQQVMVSMSILT